MQYRLHTLMLLAGVVPPLTAFLWFHWKSLLLAGTGLLVVYVWVWLSLTIARSFGTLVASLMG